MAMNVAQHPDNKEKGQLTFSAYRTSRKHLYLFQRHLSLLIRDYINGNTHLQADTRNSARDCSRGSFCSTRLLSFKKQLTHSILVKLKRNGAFKFRAAYIIWVKEKHSVVMAIYITFDWALASLKVENTHLHLTHKRKFSKGLFACFIFSVLHNSFLSKRNFKSQSILEQHK